MEHSLEHEIQAYLIEYLAGHGTLDDFKLWLVAATWSLDQTQPIPDIQFANEIKLVLAEHSGGFLSDEELRNELDALQHRIQADAMVRG